jgi:hypothetical protein
MGKGRGKRKRSIIDKAIFAALEVEDRYHGLGMVQLDELIAVYCTVIVPMYVMSLAGRDAGTITVEHKKRSGRLSLFPASLFGDG